jgi:hypothetical protein
MNERIKLLADRAWIDNDQLDACGYTDLQKFAELIVLECVQVINQPNGVGDDDVIRISDDVKQHFGVSEMLFLKQHFGVE